MSSWSIVSSLEEWEGVSIKIEKELEKFGFSQGFVFSLMTAMDEVFANISIHGYGEKQGTVTVKTELLKSETEQSAGVLFVDGAKPFNPVLAFVDKEEFCAKASERKKGGLGIFIAKKQVDEMKYEYKNGLNNLTLIKKESL